MADSANTANRNEAMNGTGTGRPAFEAKPVPRQKRSDLLVEQIKRWIVSHAMQPGDELPREKELIEKLGMSRGTVREALRAYRAEQTDQVLAQPDPREDG